MFQKDIFSIFYQVKIHGDSANYSEEKTFFDDQSKSREGPQGTLDLTTG